MRAMLSDGFEVAIRDEVVGDWEFLEVLNDIDEGEEGLIVRAARMMLGKEGVKILKDHLRDEQGKVPTMAMVDALFELMESVNTLKNSEPSPA